MRLLALAAALAPLCSAFAPGSVLPATSRLSVAATSARPASLALSMREGSTRREAMGAFLAAGAGLLALRPEAATAKDVADGGLPPGLQALFGLMQTKKQWADIGKRVSEGHGEMDEKEWTNIQGYLRKLYGSGDDMTLLSKAFTRKEAEAVTEVSKGFKKAVKAIDKPAKARDWEAFMAQHKEIQGYLERFFDIRAGKLDEASGATVPDEI